MSKNDFEVIPTKKLPNTKAWKLTSEYVRLRGKGICYTCGKKYPFNKLVAGHFVEKLGNAGTYFDLDNLRCQCQWYCNRMGHGRKDIYAEKLEAELGFGIIQELRKRASKSKQWTRKELNDIAEQRQKDIDNLKNGTKKSL